MNSPHDSAASAEPSASNGAVSPDLFWQAFRYVSDDETQADGSPSAESAQFEERLAVDQAAREAVAQVVTLVAALKAAPAVAPAAIESVPTRSSKWLAPLSWMSVGAAAMWLIGLGLPLRSPAIVDQPSVVATPELEYPAGLAAVLSSLPDVEHADDGDAPLPPTNTYSELAMLDAYLADEADEDSPMDVPGWLLQAVSDSQRQTTSQE